MLRKAGAPPRDGVILLVVISLLVLFSLVGLAFVVYAEGQANTARLWREGETAQLPGMDPELLLSYFLGQLIYDTDNPNSALRGHSLARTMYGQRANAGSLASGVGSTAIAKGGSFEASMAQDFKGIGATTAEAVKRHLGGEKIKQGVIYVPTRLITAANVKD